MSYPMKRLAGYLGIFLLVSCATDQTKGSVPGTLQLVDLKRVTTSQDSSGQMTREEQPASSPSDEDHDGHRRRGHGRDDDSGSTADSVLNIFLNILFNTQNPDTTTTEPVPGETSYSSGPAAGPRRVILEAGYVYMRIFNNLDSHFSSPNLPDAHWDETLHLRAQGAEVTLLYGVQDYFAVGLNAGGFGDSHVANVQSETSYHVQEHIDISGGWGALEMRLYPVSFLSIHGDVGILGYTLHTRATTNTPVSTYEGFEGTQADAVVGLGGRLETPWRWPLRLYAGGRYWWIGGSQNPAIDTGVAQFDAGLSLRF